jgi:hypothetical protein
MQIDFVRGAHWRWAWGPVFIGFGGDIYLVHVELGRLFFGWEKRS